MHIAVNACKKCEINIYVIPEEEEKKIIRNIWHKITRQPSDLSIYWRLYSTCDWASNVFFFLLNGISIKDNSTETCRLFFFSWKYRGPSKTDHQGFWFKATQILIANWTFWMFISFVPHLVVSRSCKKLRFKILRKRFWLHKVICRKDECSMQMTIAAQSSSTHHLFFML